MANYFKNFTLSAVAGIMAGLSVTAFLILLNVATNLREKFQWLVIFLPLGGFFIGWLYHHFGKAAYLGNHLILKEFHCPEQRLPLRMVPLVFLGTIVTHLFGGSAGREGTAVQMGATLSDQLGRVFHLSHKQRQNLLSAGISAGFGAAIGVPFAGMVFGMEVTQIGKLRYQAWQSCFIGAWFGHLTCILLNAPHSLFPQVMVPSIDISLLVILCFLGVLFGSVARIFSHLTHITGQFFTRIISYPPLRPLIGGIILVGLFSWEASGRYLGLGIPIIQESFLSTQSLIDPVKKLLLTLLTLGSGFKGGEFTPLVFIGSTLGSSLADYLSMQPSFLAALGFAAVFAGAANTPLACAVMAAEIFGWQILPFALLVCFFSSSVSGYQGIYQNQKFFGKKHF